MLLGRYSRSEDLVSGTPLANRTRPELEGLIGYFVNTAPLRADLSGPRIGHFFAQLAASVMAFSDGFSHGAFRRDLPGIYAAGAGSPSFQQLLLRVKGVVQGAMANADVPFTRIVDAAAVPRSSAYTPVFQNMLSLQTESVSDTAPEGQGRMAPADQGGMAGLQTEALAVRAGTR